METGKSVAYAIFNLEDRGKFFIGAGEEVYQGMVIGEHSRDNDLEVNPLKGKKLTNIRASGSDEAVKLTTPTRMNLEQAISYINDDELVEDDDTEKKEAEVISSTVKQKLDQMDASAASLSDMYMFSKVISNGKTVAEAKKEEEVKA